MPDLIPVNTKYYIAETKETLVGDGVSLFPEKTKKNDVFTTSDYSYIFHENALGKNLHSDLRGWSVLVENRKKTAYSAILKSINGENVTHCNSTFKNCRRMVKAPEIPQSVVNLSGAFEGCKKLVLAPKIPDGVWCLNNAFHGCEALTTAPEIPKSVTELDWAFQGCKKLVEAPKIPDGVLSLRGTFVECESLTTAPEIPQSVEWMNGTFRNCTALTGTLICHADIKYYYIGALHGTQITAVEGDCSEKTKLELMGTKH